MYKFPIQLPMSSVMIRPAKLSMKTERDSHVSGSYYHELSEKERLTKLIY